MKKTLDDALDLPVLCDGEEGTIRDYLFLLLRAVWHEQEGFSGKRPFGDSGWEYDMYIPLIRGGFIDGTLDDDGFVSSVDDDAASEYIHDLIYHVFYGKR